MSKRFMGFLESLFGIHSYDTFVVHFTPIKEEAVMTIINESSRDIAFSQEERDGKTVIEMHIK